MLLTEILAANLPPRFSLVDLDLPRGRPLVCECYVIHRVRLHHLELARSQKVQLQKHQLQCLKFQSYMFTQAGIEIHFILRENSHNNGLKPRNHGLVRFHNTLSHFDIGIFRKHSSSGRNNSP